MEGEWQEEWGFRIKCGEGQERWLEIHLKLTGARRWSSISRRRQTEIWDKEGNQESTGVILAVTYYIRDMKLEEATSCFQAGTLMERQRHQPTHKTFISKCILSTSNEGTGDGAETEGIAI
jgi:phage baseplate assembly protein gpV